MNAIELSLNMSNTIILSKFKINLPIAKFENAVETTMLNENHGKNKLNIILLLILFSRV